MSLITTHSNATINDAGQSLVEILPVTTATIPPYTTTNAVFFGLRSFFVFDPGSPYDDQKALLRTYIEQRCRRGDKFEGIYLTHHHGDHTRSAEYLASHFSAPIYAHRIANKFLNFPYRPLDHKQIITSVGESPLLALYTPGHSDDHVVFYAKNQGILIAGDMITDRGTVLIPPQGGSLLIYLQSLDMLSHLLLSAVIPAHGQAITHQPRAFLIRAMKHRYERIKAVFDTIKDHDEQFDVTDITRLVYGNSIPENLMVFAQLNVESSLQWLKESGLVQNLHHYWRALPRDNEYQILLDRLEEIDERLRHA